MTTRHPCALLSGQAAATAQFRSIGSTPQTGRCRPAKRSTHTMEMLCNQNARELNIRGIPAHSCQAKPPPRPNFGPSGLHRKPGAVARQKGQPIQWRCYSGSQHLKFRRSASFLHTALSRSFGDQPRRCSRRYSGHRPVRLPVPKQRAAWHGNLALRCNDPSDARQGSGETPPEPGRQLARDSKRTPPIAPARPWVPAPPGTGVGPGTGRMPETVSAPRPSFVRSTS